METTLVLGFLLALLIIALGLILFLGVRTPIAHSRRRRSGDAGGYVPVWFVGGSDSGASCGSDGGGGGSASCDGGGGAS
jgi:hypothetical protein